MEPDNRAGLRVDDGDGLVEFGGDVEEAGGGIEGGLMRTDSVAEVEVADDLARGQVDDEHLMAVDAAAADAAAAVDGHEGGAAVGGGGDLVAVDAGGVLGHRRGFVAGGGVDDAEVGVALVDDQE